MVVFFTPARKKRVQLDGSIEKMKNFERCAREKSLIVRFLWDGRVCICVWFFFIFKTATSLRGCVSSSKFIRSLIAPGVKSCDGRSTRRNTALRRISERRLGRRAPIFWECDVRYYICTLFLDSSFRK
jgi:hypothetical protein